MDRFDTLEYSVSRWRFFINTCWISVTSGILIYIYTLVFGFPYGWAMFVVVARSAFWASTSMKKFTITISHDEIIGPGFMLNSERRAIARASINRRRTGIRNRRFFIEDHTGKLITARLFWYDKQSRHEITRYILDVGGSPHLTLAQIA